jgi:P22_AR N-terminal domain
MAGTELTKVPFRGAELLAVAGATPAETMVVMRPFVEAMGLSWIAQREKIERYQMLAATARKIRAVGADGKEREMTCLPLTRIN